MAGTVGVKVVVVKGLDADTMREFPLGEAVSSIGRSPGASFRLNDEAFHGELQIVREGDAYLVVNQMRHAVWLDDRSLPRGERRVWEVGAPLRATERTMLRLVLASDVTDKPRTGWLARLGLSKQAENAVYLSILLVLVPVFGVLIHAAQRSATSPGHIENVDRFAANLLGDLDKAAADEPRVWGALAASVRDARRSEGRGYRESAAAHYLAARGEAERLRAGRFAGLPPEDENLKLVARVEQLVNQQLAGPRN